MELDEILENMCIKIRQREYEHRESVNTRYTFLRQPLIAQARTDILNWIKEKMPKLETRFLSKNKLQYQMGRCDGRIDYRREAFKNLGLKEDGEE